MADTPKAYWAAPMYLSSQTLPWAANIFYLKKIFYTAPTGFHSKEVEGVAGFPAYCEEKKIAMPEIIWDYCSGYFLNSRPAFEAMEVLSPLKNSGNIHVFGIIYPRAREQISEMQQFLVQEPEILTAILQAPFEPNFVAREFMSHVMFDAFLERSGTYSDVVDYLNSFKSEQDLSGLIASVILNRLKIFCNPKDDLALLIHDQEIASLLNKIQKKKYGIEEEKSDSRQVESFAYALFSAILDPIYGQCVSKQVSQTVADIIKNQQHDIDAMIDQCNAISEDVLLFKTSDQTLKRKRLQRQITERLLNPIIELTGKSRDEGRRILIDFVTDSGIFAGALSLLLSANPSTFLFAVMAGGSATVVKHLISSSIKPTTPTKLIVMGLKKMKISDEVYMNQLSRIMENIKIQ